MLNRTATMTQRLSAHLFFAARYSASPLLLLLIPAPAFAVSCSTAGLTQYTSGDTQYCNGTSWTSMKGASVGSCAGTTAGTERYNAGEIDFCDGTNWYSMKGSSITSCSGTTAGTMTYDSSLTKLKFCDGTNWYDMTAVSGPVLAGLTSSVGFTEGGSAVTLSSGATVTDGASSTLASAYVQISAGNFAGDGGTLAATTAGTSITASYNTTTETLTLSGTDTLAHYQTVLQSVTFVTASTNPDLYGTKTSRTVSWQLNDGTNTSTLLTTTVNITAVNNAPTLSNVPATLAYTQQAAAKTIAPSAAVSDVDNQNLASATVSITANATAGDVLAATTTGTSITASYNSSTYVMTLSGSDTLAHYQLVLDQVKFSATTRPPNTRTVHWQANDGSASNNLSPTYTTTITVAPVPP